MKTKLFCYSCESEFTLTSTITEDAKFCPYCGTELEGADIDDVEEYEEE
jgi:rRNA maturation endonuclease Nob1